jgi:hypothetical protein
MQNHTNMLHGLNKNNKTFCEGMQTVKPRALPIRTDVRAGYSPKCDICYNSCKNRGGDDYSCRFRDCKDECRWE